MQSSNSNNRSFRKSKDNAIFHKANQRYQQALDKVHKAISNEKTHVKSKRHHKQIYDELLKRKQFLEDAIQEEKRKARGDPPSELHSKRQQQLEYRQALDQQITKRQQIRESEQKAQRSLDKSQIKAQPKPPTPPVPDNPEFSDSSAHETELQDEFDEEEMYRRNRELEAERERILSRYSKIIGTSRLRKLSQQNPEQASRQSTARSSSTRHSQSRSITSQYTPEEAIELYKKLTAQENEIRKEKEELFRLLEETRSSRATSRMTTVSRLMPRHLSPLKLEEPKYKAVSAVPQLPQLSTPSHISRPQKQKQEEDAASVISRIFDD